jgi:ribosome maturation factor RimP
MTPTAMPEALLSELQQIAAGEGCRLLNSEFRGPTLQLMLDHPEGVTLEHCTSVSRQASALLDVEDFGGQKYVLEVTSPGLDRPLFEAQDYQRFTGSLIRMRFRDSATGKPRSVTARLGDFEDVDGGLVHLTEIEGSDDLVIRLPDVERARLEIAL